MRRYFMLLTLVLCTNIWYSTAHLFHGTTSSAHFTCHCSRGTACTRSRGTNSGTCSSGCDRPWGSWAPWSGPGCQIGNVAYGKVTDQHAYRDGRYPSSKAVDGLRSTDVSDEQCSMASRPLSGVAYWNVDLESNHVVQSVYITTVYSRQEDRNDIKIYVSYRTNYVLSDECTSKSADTTITVNCNNKIGRYVTVAGTISNAELWLTEVYVKGYQYYQCNQQYSGDYWFGPACLNNCHCNRQCDAVTGVCGGTCKAGYTGSTCQTTCSSNYWGANCANRCYCSPTCNRATGSCGGRTCNAGWRGASCNEQCASYTWGAGSSSRGCPKSCNCARSSEICTRSNGHCPSGCAPWFTRTGCDYEMPRLGESDVPVRVDGNGRNVTIRFMQWSTSMGGDGRATDMSYKLHFFVLSSDADQENACDEVITHIMSDTFNIINCTLPEVRTNYTIWVVPYEESTNYRGAGEPSPALHVFTGCQLGYTGEDCQVFDAISTTLDSQSAMYTTTTVETTATPLLSEACKSESLCYSAGLVAGMSVGSVILGMFIGFVASYTIYKRMARNKGNPDASELNFQSNMDPPQSIVGYNNTGEGCTRESQLYYETVGLETGEEKHQHYENSTADEVPSQPSPDISCNNNYDKLKTADVNSNSRTNEYEILQKE